MKNLSYVIVSFLFLLVSCVGETGPEGPIGPAGVAGPTGADGVIGATGADGNANVQVINYSSPTWNTAANIMDLTVPEITSSVSDNDVVLGFVDLGLWYSTDGFHGQGFSGDYFRSYHFVGGFTIKAFLADNTADPSPPFVNTAKIIIIASSSTSTVSGNGRSVSPQQAIYDELAAAGVDITIYEQVAAYYGIKD